MKIGGFEVGDWAVKEEAGKRNLLFACRDCIYSANVVTDQACRYHVIKILSEVQADVTVLSEVYERVYTELQTRELSEIAQLMNKFAVESVWATNNLGNPQNKADEAYLSNRYRVVITIAQDLIAFDPIRAYITCLQEVVREQARHDKGNDDYKKGSATFLKTLNYLRTEFENTLMIQTAKNSSPSSRKSRTPKKSTRPCWRQKSSHPLLVHDCCLKKLKSSNCWTNTQSEKPQSKFLGTLPEQKLCISLTRRNIH